MAIPHAKPGEIVDVAPLGPRLGGAQTTTLVKTGTLEVLRLVLPAGKEIAPHTVPGEITVQCLEGRVAFRARGGQHELTAGQLVYLAGSDEHALRALEDSSVLVTILLAPKPA
jgi:quercetin dioxygenase-like cupin family protein